MSHLILDYFGDGKTRLLTCPICGWTGTFQQGLTEIYDDLVDCQCPGDHGHLDRPMLAVILHPTLKDYRAHWDRLSETEKAYVELIESSLDRFSRLKLKAADQLPDLPDPVLDLLWDQEGDEVVIRLRDREIWREPVRYEALWRFEQVLALLKGKYGPRLRDLEPTKASICYLYGDKLGCPRVLDNIRKELWEAWDAASGHSRVHGD